MQAVKIAIVTVKFEGNSPIDGYFGTKHYLKTRGRGRQKWLAKATEYSSADD